MVRHCSYEPGYYDDAQFIADPRGYIHNVAPLHFARTGALTSLPPVDPALLTRSPFADLLASLARLAEETAVRGGSLDAITDAPEDEHARLELELLRLVDRLSLHDLRELVGLVRGRVGS
jgi:hypothetical protein